ncbi:MAG: twin-arginine translocase TatA/TatE family subunit [Gammaproteobacteria bacterium]|jgi:sec-independent protein translocase protein TatA|nr:twin-arginine translocase TatA/TatE family subunit [Gammaproteobacteria bacterium]MBM4209174.1 twin-arginine translocase TatA/TatE family subunit [Gammaproteobacteria bacterium]MBM4229601.1 twin-arginine translocase TatA/TatE family subunit [Gammaproteobacteria bacterium]NBS66809.1 twin-arginine translocase TatA/TatE family subunit [Betaproteobacteria bacterium]
MGIGMRELIIILLVVLLVFGAKKLRTIGADLGAAVKGFKKGMDDGDAEESLKQIKQEAADADFPESSAKTAANKPADRNG